jgi:hypothetical protein
MVWQRAGGDRGLGRVAGLAADGRRGRGGRADGRSDVADAGAGHDQDSGGQQQGQHSLATILI